MTIELKGVGTVNKGAHLMLLSVLNEFERRQRSEKFCIEPGYGIDYFAAAEHSIYLKANWKGKKIPWNFVLSLLPKKTLDRYGLILDKEIDVILEGSGFAYGDFWGPQKVYNRLGNFLENKTKPNTKLILLPQAFGPFENQKLKRAFAKVVQKADLIFARDKISYQHLVDNYGERSNILLAPDFTNRLSSGEKKEYQEGNVCIIPNRKMIPTVEDQERYYDFLIKSIKLVKSLGYKPYFLIHEIRKDESIAVELNKNLEVPLDIVRTEDAIEIKNRIKSSEFIIVSRFHGLVSAVSQGIPALSTSWSHKYRELLQDYNLEENVVDIRNYDWEKIKRILTDFAETPREEYYKSQETYIKNEKKKTEKMWDQVFKVIYEKK